MHTIYYSSEFPEEPKREGEKQTRKRKRASKDVVSVKSSMAWSTRKESEALITQQNYFPLRQGSQSLVVLPQNRHWQRAVIGGGGVIISWIRWLCQWQVILWRKGQLWAVSLHSHCWGQRGGGSSQGKGGLGRTPECLPHQPSPSLMWTTAIDFLLESLPLDSTISNSPSTLQPIWSFQKENLIMQLFKIKKKAKFLNISQPFIWPYTTFLALFSKILFTHLHFMLHSHTHIYMHDVCTCTDFCSNSIRLTLHTLSCCHAFIPRLICLEFLTPFPLIYLRNSYSFSNSMCSVTHKAFPDFLSQTHPTPS